MNSKQYTFYLEPKGRVRYKAGDYDSRSYLPEYELKMLTPNEDVNKKISIERIIMGTKENQFLVWDIVNNSTYPVFFKVMKDGILESSTL